MSAPLNIRDIGATRKAALEAEARLRGQSLAEVVREFIDLGVAQARAVREREAWQRAARAGLADEFRYLETNGPSLARFRRV